ncbi:MAG: ATP-binding cassette domain-containing protein [Prevotella sp.]|nr:ATP-binding cassette domain-containing protein [Prevotella sp.]
MLIDYRKVTIYQDDVCVLNDIDFNVDDGEFVYIIGKVGSGKSSLLKTLYCELDIESAEKAEVLGKDVMKIKRREIPQLRREMGIIFQDFQLLHDRTVEKNLDFVLKATGWKKSERSQRIVDVLETVGLADKAKKMPHELSGGEQQRIAIARALLNKPKIIVADEPTGNLDPETASNIISLLRQISLTGTAIVMSTHNIPMLDKFPGIVYRCSETSISDITNTYNSIDLTAEKEES